MYTFVPVELKDYPEVELFVKEADLSSNVRGRPLILYFLVSIERHHRSIPVFLIARDGNGQPLVADVL